MAVLPPGKPIFFASASELRAWLKKNHRTATELWVGCYKKATGKPTVTWQEMVDEVLCFGWIDGLRRGIDEHSFMQRITPRRARSIWSAINIARIGELEAAGRMTPAGREAFATRDAARAGLYSNERTDPAKLTAAEMRQFKATPGAWAFFSAQSPSHRRVVLHWITSAKRAETRQRRLDALIEDSAAGRLIGPMANRKSAAVRRP